ncbi:hypothetical protein DSM106972_015040 [Dulcicalothrix desertica PCC 7102]|uniref:Uncharacterized protein n=1 Tax=Dulcicalothrix desertica PCC 7102 TaxID=232991 RepID=A0A433VQF1_9CYAN|nr:hypothetical protein [Dulcicalothrix desertica]RUT08336.1 hypothetical protein DSM106972_015040 [Dulcicalothrix desertica PCC 7102]TWH40201.1 hypothetical protein CAL7102_09505 [Dulcicalothrix desertica PCC 7102]
MSSNNLISKLNTELFTELSTEQAAVVEGGLNQVQILTVRCIKAGADSDGTDEVFASFNGTDSNFGRPISMRTGSVANFGQSGGSGNSIQVALFDKDGSNRGAADLLGSFRVSSPVRNPQTRRISGNGSTYEVTFRAF